MTSIDLIYELLLFLTLMIWRNSEFRPFGNHGIALRIGFCRVLMVSSVLYRHVQK